ncbi:hypothetical protein Tco_1247450 [Tanacetum coccineum]
MSVYIQKKINDDLQFAAGLSQLWEVLYSRVDGHTLLIAELNVFGDPLAMQCAKFLKQLSQTEVLNMLEIRKTIAEMGMILLGYPRLQSKKSGMDNSFSLGSTKKANNVKILCLLLVYRDDIGSREFTIYEMMIGCSVWTIRYRVDTDDFMTPLPEGWSIRSIVWSIVLGEREQDSLLEINLSGKVVQYNLISKTPHEIYDCGSN